ncbi:hypothetical protein RJ55_10023 [Drechmeria coniospora]|nr:hypothetical protein RJ55_10023 [Drechmeria coniospora]
MKFTNALIFATAASAAAVQSQRIRLDTPQDTGADFLEGMRLDIPKRVNTDIPQNINTNIPQKVDTNTPQKVDTNILKKVDTTLDAAVTAINQGNQSLNSEFFQSRFFPLIDFIKHETVKIDTSLEDLSTDDAYRLFKPAENLPRLAAALHSALDREDVKATIVQNKACSIVRASIFGLQDVLNNLKSIIGYTLPKFAKNTDCETLLSFTNSLGQTGAMFHDC